MGSTVVPVIKLLLDAGTMSVMLLVVYCGSLLSLPGHWSKRQKSSSKSAERTEKIAGLECERPKFKGGRGHEAFLF
jgi:hypothetical protein